jgi:hypothetical protein
MKRRTVAALAAIVCMPFIVLSCDEARARTTCSEARSLCGKQRVCRERFQACMRTGCWAVWRLRKCGYVRE